MTAELTSARHGKQRLLWNPAQLEAAEPEIFDPAWWRSRQALTGEASGRGSAWFVGEAGREWVLRHYRRGGIFAGLLRDRYAWLGVEQTRAFSEMRLLQTLWNAGLPVPEPVAARVCRHGVTYTGDLLTVRLDQATPLADHLFQQRLSALAWRDLGALLAQFHVEGVFHHDLNARNILVDGDQGFALIDFDKGRLRKPGRWCEKNLARLRRSLDKFAGQSLKFHFLDADWQALRGGYVAYRNEHLG